MIRKLTTFWRKVDGPLGAILFGVALLFFGYIVRGFEDGGIVATLIEKVNSAGKDARSDEREQCNTRLENVLGGYQSQAKLRDQQVATLIQQNRVLLGLVNKQIADQSAALRKATEAANQASKAADAAQAAQQKANEVSKKLDTATNPRAVVPPTPWAGNKR